MRYSEVKYQPERARTYLGSPSITRAPDGALVATHDHFGAGSPRNHEGEEALLSVYRSEDEGQTWVNVTHVMNQYWSSVFTHRGALYLLGTSQQYGSIVIRRSDDGGFTWTRAGDRKSGLLDQGGFFHDNPNYHCAPVPVLSHAGRLWRAFEDCRDARWGPGFQSLVLSVPEDADLLDADSWTMTNKLAFDPAWLPDDWKPVVNAGWLEGNMVLAPDGQLLNILRLQSDPQLDKAAVVRISADGTKAEFERIIDFPGGITKFSIRHCQPCGLYLTLANASMDPAEIPQRNVLALCASHDLHTWRVVHELLRDESGLEWDMSRRLTGFQYVDWQFDGADILYLVRTAYRGAHNFHDSNRITFHRLTDYAQLL